MNQVPYYDIKGKLDSPDLSELKLQGFNHQVKGSTAAVVLSNAGGYRITHNGNQINVVSNLHYSMPVWFKDGDVISFGVGPTPSGLNISCTNGMLVSIIEFNVIP